MVRLAQKRGECGASKVGKSIFWQCFARKAERVKGHHLNLGFLEDPVDSDTSIDADPVYTYLYYKESTRKT